MKLRVLFLPALLGCALTVLCLVFYVSRYSIDPADLQADANKVNELNSLKEALNGYYKIRRDLPQNLAELNSEKTSRPRVFLSSEAYSYTRLSDTAYQVCTNFQTSAEHSSSYLRNNPEYGDLFKYTTGNYFLVFA